ncbi:MULTISPECIES: Arc family DNA-binding protein [unclassified Acinetobacter]|uniref:Arc family DNA-binding protein n=1 Tax=unclassified Acinetobacter TaxID=196816 RepID=UPI0015D3E21C|nr:MULTISPECIES: Arc family DNA-binding protein [unclassified Acinetobacter]
MSGHRNEQYNLRLPSDLKCFLVEEAKKDGRSLNNFIVKNLEQLKLKIQESAKA